MKTKLAWGLVMALFVFSLIPEMTWAAKEEESITIKCAHAFSPKMSPIDVWMQWAGEVTKRSNGRIKFEFFHGGSLAKPGEEQEACRKGVVQMVSSSATWYPSMPLWEMNGALPFQPSDTLLAIKTKWQLYQEFPELRKEIEGKNMRLMFIAAYGSFQIISRKPLKSLDDFKGLKIAILGQQQPKWFKDTGATTIFLPGPARYEALEKGVIDASLLDPVGSFSFRHFELCKNVLLCDLGQYCSLFMAMNQDTWNKLLPEDQKMIDDLNKETMFEWFPKRVKSDNAKTFAISEKDFGVTFRQMSDDERTKWANSLPNLAQSWIDEAKDASDREVRKRMWLRDLEITRSGGYQWPMDWSDVK
jgi:TRAP-type C4-dicarboxylate transport system substrate-binding protein